MTMDRFREGTHISISMIKEATGTALTAAMAGASKSLRKEKAPARPASRVPKKAASRKPPIIRKKKRQWTTRNQAGVLGHKGAAGQKQEILTVSPVQCKGWQAPRPPATGLQPRDGCGFVLFVCACFSLRIRVFSAVNSQLVHLL